MELRRGSIECVLGPMFSNKSSELQNRAKSMILSGLDIIFIVPKCDTRYSSSSAIPMAVTHDMQCALAISVTDLFEDPPQLLENKVDAILIDEAHFIPGLGAFCLRHRKAGKQIVCAGLSSDSTGNYWPILTEIVPAHCDIITLKHAVCVVCKRDACYTRRINDDSREIISIGGDEQYLPTCYIHLHSPAVLHQEVMRERKRAVAHIRATLKTSIN